jgi:hypothetical protein
METVELFSDAGYFYIRRSAAELAGVSPEMGSLLGGEDARLYLWHFWGETRDLDQELILPGG